MIPQKEIITTSEKYGVPSRTIDKDWILGHLLNAMYSFEDVQNCFVFKGGTCLKKCFIEDYRFSEDLDFTFTDNSFPVEQKTITNWIRKAEKESRAKFHIEEIKPQVSEEVDQGYGVKIKFWGADHPPNQRPVPPKRWQTSIKLDISYSEKLIFPPVKKEIFHPYSDHKSIINKATTYDQKEIVAEKIRSLAQRNRPRDVYDNWYFSKWINKADYPLIKKALIKKAKDKHIGIDGLELFINDDKKEKNNRAWTNSLSHQIDQDNLPDFNEAYTQMTSFIKNILAV